MTDDTTEMAKTAKTEQTTAEGCWLMSSRHVCCPSSPSSLPPPLNLAPTTAVSNCSQGGLQVLLANPPSPDNSCLSPMSSCSWGGSQVLMARTTIPKPCNDMAPAPSPMSDCLWGGSQVLTTTPMVMCAAPQDNQHAQ